MKAGRGKRKGSGFERLLCTQLSQWWTGGQRDDVFWRTAGSGARATVRARKGKKTQPHCGDICAIDPIGKPLTDVFAVELKRGHNKHTLADMYDRPYRAAKVGYEAWFAQAITSKENSDAFAWMLIHKRDKREAMVFFPYYVYDILVQMGCGFQLDVIPLVRLIDVVRFSNSKRVETVSIVGTHLRQWLQVVTPNSIQELAKDI